MVVFPAVAALVSVVFAGALLVQFAHTKRLAQLAWGIALVQFAVASLAVAAGVANGWDPTLYRAFWLFGAILNVPWLAVGSIALASRAKAGVAAFVAVFGLSAYALWRVVGAQLDAAALAAETGIPRGREVWTPGSGQVELARAASISAWLIVVGLALWSSRRRKGYAPPRPRVVGNLLIASGVTIVAVGGFALSRIGRGSAFSVALALGVLVMYVGFLLASRAPRFRVDEPGDSPT